ncbi:hypothetical protein [Pseudomonas sp. LFM046]|uniref:hypothetical protein n=1 Tax=Pseudomonas sp. LFM046 TaxID=1608357 RepID=UPI0005CFCD4A|nr:hypothetical protein [Pseudomonas sp. LFM046]
MKRTALLFSAALLASPAFADDLCAINLQKLDDAMASYPTIGEPLRQQVTDLRTKAEQAQQVGDTEACVNASTLALQRLQQPDSNGNGAGGSS